MIRQIWGFIAAAFNTLPRIVHLVLIHSRDAEPLCFLPYRMGAASHAQMHTLTPLCVNARKRRLDHVRKVMLTKKKAFSAACTGGINLKDNPVLSFRSRFLAT